MYCTHLDCKNQEVCGIFLLRFYDRKAALLAKSRFSSYHRVFFQKSFVSRFRQEDAARQRLKGRRDGIAGGALAVSSRDDGAAAIHRAEGHTSGAAVNEVRLCLLGQLAMGKMAAIFVHAQQLCNGQPPDFADNENVQPAVIRDCFRPGEETAAVGFAVADGAHQAVHRQRLAGTWGCRRPPVRPAPPRRW